MKRIRVVVCCIIMMFLLAGCGEEQKVQNATKEFCEAIKAVDVDALSNYVEGESSTNSVGLSKDDKYSQGFLDFIRDNAKNTTFEIGEINVTGDTATCEVSFEYNDTTEVVNAALKEMFYTAMQNAFSGDKDETDYSMLLIDKLNEAKSTTEISRDSRVLVVNLVKTNGEWKVSIPKGDETYSDIVSCNVSKVLKEFADALNESNLK